MEFGLSPVEYVFSPPPLPSLPIRGVAARFPVGRLFFVGRNYHAHAVEMGKPVDRQTAQLFYFTKSPSTLVESGATVGYPAETSNYQHEIELVVALNSGGFRVSAQEVPEMIFGYACGLDMTRRDLQLAARDAGRPWDLGKDVEESSIVSAIAPREDGPLISRGRIEVRVNGQVRQSSDVAQMIWNVSEIIVDLSRFYHLQPGDLIFTGTPAGVGPVQAGDSIEGSVEGVGGIAVAIAPSTPGS